MSLLVTTKLVRPNNQKELIDATSEEKIAKDLVNMSMLVPGSKATIVVESQAEKLERKALAEERRHERIIEQQKLAHQMEDLMEKVLHETPLSKKEEDHLRTKIKTIVDKVTKESDRTSLHSPSPVESESVDQSNPVQPTSQGAFFLWYDRHLN